MSSLSIGRDAAGARTLRVWSTATLATFILAACGGGGGDSAAPPPQNPPPQNPPPSAPTNAAPTASAGADVSVALPTDTAALSGTATDDGLPANSTLSYTWEFVTGPSGPNNSPGAVVASPTSANTNVQFRGGTGDYTFNLKASDGTLTSAADPVVVTVTANTYTFPTAVGTAGWATATTAEAKMDPVKLDAARDYSTTAALGTAEAGMVVRGGKLVYSWGIAGATPDTRFEMKSTTKSVGGLALLLALDEGKLALSDKAIDRLATFGTEPSVEVVAGSLSDVTLFQLATHTAGFTKSDNVAIEARKLNFAPGTRWSYSDQGLNWLADVLTNVYGQDLQTFMFSRVYTTLGIRLNSDLLWGTHGYRTPTLNNVQRRELASGLNATVNAMARIGVLMLNKGVWGNTQILSNSIVARAHAPSPEISSLPIELPAQFPGATANYGVLWWTNNNHQLPNVPTDAYWAWGLHETLIIVVPSLDLVIARAGARGWHPGNEVWNGDYAVLDQFITPIVTSITP
jgi:CubicO group peptidase (beta-lactamase class C family)